MTKSAKKPQTGRRLRRFWVRSDERHPVDSRQRPVQVHDAVGGADAVREHPRSLQVHRPPQEGNVDAGSGGRPAGEDQPHEASLRWTKRERRYCEEKFLLDRAVVLGLPANYRFNPNGSDGDVERRQARTRDCRALCRTILWEVPLLALISETYYEHIDTNWSEDGQDEQMLSKSIMPADGNVLWGDFGTRRRRNFAAQERVVRICAKNKNFTGTSNCVLRHEVRREASGYDGA